MSRPDIFARPRPDKVEPLHPNHPDAHRHENDNPYMDAQDTGQAPAATIKATPWAFMDPASIAPRDWIYGHHLIRKYVSATIAPGSTGKSALIATDVLAMVSGRTLLHDRPHERLRVWLWNGEDPRNELDRRLAATAMHYGLTVDDIGDRLFMDSGREVPIIIGEVVQGSARVAMPVVDALVAEIKARRVDVLIIDPFVSAHRLPENDNGAMDAAVKAFALVADRTGCAIDLVHHTRKLNGADADMDAARGGSAIAGAVRSARALNVMSDDIAKGFGIDGEAERRRHVRVDNAKANLAPPAAATWFALASVDLGNGTADRPSDQVGVPEAWTPPDAFEGITLADLMAVQREVDGKEYRDNSQATDWVGHAIGKVLEIDTEEKAGRERVKKLVGTWKASKALRVTEIHDARRGRDVKVVEVGEWASSTP